MNEAQKFNEQFDKWVKRLVEEREGRHFPTLTELLEKVSKDKSTGGA